VVVLLFGVPVEGSPQAFCFRAAVLDALLCAGLRLGGLLLWLRVLPVVRVWAGLLLLLGRPQLLYLRAAEGLGAFPCGVGVGLRLAVCGGAGLRLGGWLLGLRVL
jgi:hypothetical protein